jgi:YihY family inner membrane protein
MSAGVRSPWRLGIETILLYGQINGDQRAAAFAYYVLFSLFPLFALLLSLGSLFVRGEEIVEAIGGVLPLDAAQQAFLWDSVSALERSRGGVSLLSVGILLWCSLRFFQALVHGVNRAWHTIEIPWWQMPLKNLLMIAVLGSALFAGLFIPALLQGAGAALRAAAGFLHEHFPAIDTDAVGSLLDLIRYALGAAVLFYSFSMLYMLAPRRRVRLREVWLPALFVTFALQACQVAFVKLLPHIINYGIYGAVGGMMFVVMWVYVSGAVIMLGACFCAVLNTTPSTREY